MGVIGSGRNERISIVCSLYKRGFLLNSIFNQHLSNPYNEKTSTYEKFLMQKFVTIFIIIIRIIPTKKSITYVSLFVLIFKQFV